MQPVIRCAISGRVMYQKCRCIRTVSLINALQFSLCRFTDVISLYSLFYHYPVINPLTPNDLYMSHTAPLTSKRCILYIYSTNVGTEYFKHDIYSPSFSLQNAVCFIMLTFFVPVLFTFYIQDVLKLKKNNFRAKGLSQFLVFRMGDVTPHETSLSSFLLRLRSSS